MITDDKITKAEPNNVEIVGTSSHIKKPNIIPNIKAKYFNGVTNETSDNLYDWLKSKFATPPNTPTRDNKIKSFNDGITHPNGKDINPNIVIDAEK